MPARHTPGPWRVDPGGNGQVQTADGKMEICILFAAANGPLIAAAPDLLTALRQIVALRSWDGPEMRDIARVAVARAEGAS